MKGTTVLLVVGGLAVLGLVLYFATQRQTPQGGLFGLGAGGAPGTASGLIASIGAGLTGLTATIVGAVEQEEAREAAAGSAPEEPGLGRELDSP